MLLMVFPAPRSYGLSPCICHWCVVENEKGRQGKGAPRFPNKRWVLGNWDVNSHGRATGRIETRMLNNLLPVCDSRRSIQVCTCSGGWPICQRRRRHLPHTRRQHGFEQRLRRAGAGPRAHLLGATLPEGPQTEAICFACPSGLTVWVYVYTRDFAYCRLMICAACACPVSQQTGCAKHTGWDPVGFRVLFRVSVDLAHHCHPPPTIQARISHVPRPMGGTTWPKPDAKLHPLLESNMYCTSLPCRGIVLHTVLEGRMHIWLMAPHIQSCVWSLLALAADVPYQINSLKNMSHHTNLPKRYYIGLSNLNGDVRVIRMLPCVNRAVGLLAAGQLGINQQANLSRGSLNQLVPALKLDGRLAAWKCNHG